MQPKTIQFNFNRSVSVGIPTEITPYQREIVKYAANAYWIVLQIGQIYSFSEFADEIAKYYDRNSPQTSEVIRVLKLV